MKLANHPFNQTLDSINLARADTNRRIVALLKEYGWQIENPIPGTGLRWSKKTAEIDVSGYTCEQACLLEKNL